jgi:glycosyltransferase involved in cell wall biosynthesis
MFLEITRLSYRKIFNKPLSGIDRVNYAYVRYAKKSNWSLVIWNGRSFRILTKFEENILFRNKLNFIDQIKFILIQSYFYFLSFVKNTNLFLDKKIFINVSHYALDKNIFWSTLKQCNCYIVIFIHDLIPIKHPRYTRKTQYQKHFRRIENTLKFANQIIVNSNYTKRELIKFSKRIQVINKNIDFIHLGSDNFRKGKYIQKLNKIKYFICLGNIEKRKNYLLLLKVWKHLVKSNYQYLRKLIIIGNKGFGHQEFYNQFNSNLKISKYIKILPEQSDSQVQKYLKNAIALLFPTFTEGFGLPLVESLSLKVPVISSKLETFKEINGNIPEYILTNNFKKWLKVIKEYSRPNSLLRLKQVNRIKNYEINYWSDHFKKFSKILPKQCNI